MKNIKVIVKKKFLDRYTGKYNKPGDKLTITDARFREIKHSGDFVEVEKTTAKTETKASEETKK
jgi:ribosomal protein S17